ALALAMRVQGRALLKCTIDDAGVVESCSALSEEPRGLGFGDAAVKISSSFRFKPGVGENASDHEVRIPIKFALPFAKRAMP
ncbi:energy transducer TonB, partial [Propionibacterium freudenreichii]|uniref:energy transducer TonB family protein n=1 Tax=Propionibacterium freudenreichii TaxID=1744 RepID=UPI003855406C